MPKSDYSKGKIYKLQCEDGYFYIGSTASHYLSSRLANHRANSNESKNSKTKVYKHINSIGWEKVKIILIELFPCSCVEELKQKENEYIFKELNNKFCLNNNRAIINDEQKKEYKKQQKQKEKDFRNKLITCECGLEVKQGRFNQHINSVKHSKEMNNKSN